MTKTFCDVCGREIKEISKGKEYKVRVKLRAVEKANNDYAKAYIKGFEDGVKSCFGKCERCVWKENGGCNEWR